MSNSRFFTTISNHLYRGFRSIGFRILYKIFCLLKVKPNRILLASDSHSRLEGNFAFIYSEIQRQNLTTDVKFMLKKTIDTKKTVKEIILLAYYMATARFIIIDDFYPMVYPLKIRGNADLIQVWHAVGAFKKFGYSRSEITLGNGNAHRNYTKVIVSSRNVVSHYAEGFGISVDKIYPLGVPRTDIFFDEEFKKKKVEELKKIFPAKKSKKVILFAPTFRGRGQSTAYYPIGNLDLRLLYEKLNDEYVFFIKLHPFVREKVEIPIQYRDFLYTLSDEMEINDFLVITDILITDYSSVCFEFALFNKPMLFLANDLEEYKAQRDFYFDYQSFIPGKLVRTTEEIVEKINNGDYSLEKVQSFVSHFYDDKDGKSSQRFVDRVLKPYL